MGHHVMPTNLHFLTAAKLYTFLQHWLAHQEARYPRNPWTHEIRIPEQFGHLVREMQALYPGSIELNGVQYRATPDWMGWMAFCGYVLVIHTGREFQMALLSDNTKSLIKGNGGQSPLVVEIVPRPKSEGQSRRELAAHNKQKAFYRSLTK